MILIARVGRSPDKEHPIFRCIAGLKHGCDPSEVSAEQLEGIQLAAVHTAICSGNPNKDEPEEGTKARIGIFMARAGIPDDHPRHARVMRYASALAKGDVTFPSLVGQGTYKHFKGGHYSVLFLARSCEDPTKTLVVYVHLDDGSVWVRELGDFVRTVDWPDGRLRSRFVRESP